MPAIHDERIEFVLPRSAHYLVELWQVIRVNLLNHLTAQLQILLVMRMDILILVGFNIVIALLRNNDRTLFQQLLHFFAGEDILKNLFLRCLLLATYKIPSVMAGTQVIIVQIFPSPIKGAQIRIPAVLIGDVIASIIALITQALLHLIAAHLHRDIKRRILRHGIGFMG